MRCGTGVAAALALSLSCPAFAGDVEVGKEFPNFTAKDFITGKSFSLKDLRGYVVLVDYWATW